MVGSIIPGHSHLDPWRLKVLHVTQILSAANLQWLYAYEEWAPTALQQNQIQKDILCTITLPVNPSDSGGKIVAPQLLKCYAVLLLASHLNFLF